MLFSANTPQGQVERIYDVLYLASNSGKYSYADVVEIVADEAAAYQTAKRAEGMGKILATAATPPDSLDRDLATLRVENAMDELGIYPRTVTKLKDKGVPDETLQAIDVHLRNLLGGNIVGVNRPSR